MFSICVTVAMTWSLKAMSEILLLLRAMRRYRRLGPKPKPANNSCWMVRRNIELVAGAKNRKARLVDWRLLVESKEKLTPVGKPPRRSHVGGTRIQFHPSTPLHFPVS